MAELYTQGLAPIVYIAGGIGNKSFQTGRILSHMIRDDLVKCGIPSDAIIVDEHSTNTLEDALHGKDIFRKSGIVHRRILFACKWPHGGRCLRTLKKIFSESELFPFMYDFKYNDHIVTKDIRDNWWRHNEARSFVWGEYQRIILYSSRGDICP